MREYAVHRSRMLPALICCSSLMLMLSRIFRHKCYTNRRISPAHRHCLSPVAVAAETGTELTAFMRRKRM